MEGLGHLDRGRESYRRCSWLDSYTSLSLADQESLLGPEDLELLARAAYLIARDDDCLSTLRRAHQAYLDRVDAVSAARCAFWLGFRLLSLGEIGQATGWLAWAHHLLEQEEGDCVERADTSSCRWCYNISPPATTKRPALRRPAPWR